jgi:hypothetical protein
LAENGNGYIMPIKESVQSLKREGHPDQEDFRFVRPSSEKTESVRNLQSTSC